VKVPSQLDPAIDPAAWHDVECASYRADLPLWRELAAERGGPVLDIGCGTGRVALDLALLGHEVIGVDAETSLVAALNARASALGLTASAIAADARALSIGRRFPLAILPMQVAQLLGGSSGRASMLEALRGHMEPGGLLAVALADPFDAVEPGESLPPLPDVLEIDGWTFSSAPVAVRDEGDAVAIDRLRSARSPSGETSEELATIRLDLCAPGTLEAEARTAGFQPLPSRHVSPTADYVGSTVVLLGAPS
jgi:SAM-dependent methyltransferase